MVMTSRLYRCVLFIAAALGARPGVAAPAGGSPFDGDAQFQQRITVRVAGMPLDQLLPRLGAKLGVSLETATADVGDIRVSVFAEDLPAEQILTALTRMLDLVPEGGFTWSRARGGSRPTYQLNRSQQARLLAAQRLRRDEAALAAGFESQIRALNHDPERQKQWVDPNPVPRLQRASWLLASLPDDQLAQLQRDGVLMLRQREVSPEQQKIMGRLVSDLTGSMDSFLTDHPEEAPRYQNIDPAATTIMIELHQQPPSQSVVIRLNLGPDKGGSRYPVWSSPPASSTGPGTTATTTRPSTTREPVDQDAPKIALHPRSWSMANVLSDLARRSRTALISDCYTVSWADLRGLPPLSLEAILDQIGHRYPMRWHRENGFILLRSEIAYARQAAEVPQRLTDRWLAQIERDGALKLETLEELCQLSDAQLFQLRDDPDISSLIHNLNFLAWSAKHPIRVYGLLSAAEQAQVARDGLRISYRGMSPLQQREFTFWAMVGAPEVPEAAYEQGGMQMLLTPDHRWQVTLSLPGRSSPDTWWLAAGRDWNTGRPLDAPTVPRAEAMVGRPAPPLAVKTLDGKPVTLPAGHGSPLLVLFRDVWAVPYVGPPLDTADLDALAALLQQPELRTRVAVICPGETAAGVKECAREQGKGLPIYADETGAVVQSYGRGPLPRLVLIAADGRIVSVRSGYNEVLSADWHALGR
jgi:hypothetical protein